MPSWFDLFIGVGAGSIGTYALLRKPARLQRHQYFLNQTGGTTAGISHDLLWTAHVLLRQALEERRTPVWRSADNHSARFAPIIVIAITTAFDAWMNELVAFGRTWIGLPQDEIAKIIDIGTVPEKYERISELLLGRRLRQSADLRNLSRLRNEIVHFLPYTQIISEKTVPDWLHYLEQKKLLITSKASALTKTYPPLPTKS